MKGRPILFSAPMVRAVLDGSKTQTRRALRVQPPAAARGFCTYHHPDDDRKGAHHWAMDGGSLLDFCLPCPYGQPGDRLWVREAWRTYAAFNKTPPRDITDEAPIWYEAQDVVPFHPTAYGKLRPSMFMPRWASRITLEVTGVRAERLQDINEVEAQAEGADCLRWSGIEGTAADLIDWPLKEVDNPHRNGFAVLWESINGDGSWSANPWVWVVEFRKLP